MQKVLFGFSCLAFFLFAGCRSAEEIEAMRKIDDLGLSISLATPNVVVMPIASGIYRNDFGDDQLEQLIPLLDKVEDFSVLDLSGTSVTDRSVANLYKVKKLKWLVLARTPVTIEGFTALAKCPSLERLGIESNRLSDCDLGRLQKALHQIMISLIDPDRRTGTKLPTTREYPK